MTLAPTDQGRPRQPLRLWPGVAAAVLLCVFKLVVPIVAPGSAAIAVLGGAVCGLIIVLWWMFFSRAPWSERLGVLALIVVALLVTSRLVHVSIQNGMMGLMFPFYAIPVVSVALVAGAVAGRGHSVGKRRAALALAILLGCGAFTLLRTGGITGDADSDFAWRWTKSPEERLLDQAGEALTAIPPPPAPPASAAATAMAEPGAEPAASPAVEVAAARAEEETGVVWPGFRGPERDGIVRGVRIATDWSSSPPVELWRRPIGPGWSSFAVRGNLLYTQEQRGDDEVVSCYDLTTGEPVWSHRDRARFWESNGGAGPRGTPTLADGRVYALGATGILNALDAASGAVVWSRNPASDTGTEIPGWGISSSPLVVDGLVLIAAEGKLAAYDAGTGEPRWYGPAGGGGYSSPHLLTIEGAAQVLLLSGEGAIGVAANDGKVLWRHPGSGGAPIVQPAATAEGDLLLGAGEGIDRVAVTHGSGGWTAAKRWTSNGLKPYFNDFVIHEGHAYGFDGNMLACIELENGKRKWKGGRYGGGQLVLLAEQGALLVVSEKGELALVAAKPDQFAELARFPAIQGKTWNHPVLAGDVLLVRNAEEMAAFRLARAGG